MNFRLSACLLGLLHLSRCSWGRVLLFWPVDSSERTQRLVKANVEHLVDEKIDFEVILAHYQGSRGDWDQEWYKKYVVQSMNGTGYKFHFLQKAYLAQADVWEQRYEFVWALDSDIDISRTDLKDFLEIAREVDAQIVGPTFLRAKSGSSFLQVERSRRLSDQPRTLQAGFEVNKIQQPNPACDYRHVDFVELTAPLVKSSALRKLLANCRDCIGKKSDWGFDMMWCKYVSPRHGCALVDKTPVIHLDWHMASVDPLFFITLEAAKLRFGRYWTKYQVMDCQRLGLGPQLSAKRLRAPSAL